MKNLFCLLFLFSLSSVIIGRLSSDDLKRFLDLLYEEQTEVHIHSWKFLTDDKDEVDHNLWKSSKTDESEVDIDLWNSLNDADMQRMPAIDDYSDEDTARLWLRWYFRISERFHQVSALLNWRYETNITEANGKAESDQNLRRAPFVRLAVPIAKKFNEYMKYSTDEDLQRIFGRLALGSVSDNDQETKRISQLSSQMSSIYATTEVCEPNDNTTCYQLTPYLEHLMQVEKDYERLTWAWKGWHDQCGDRIRPVYLEYIDLLNKRVKENGQESLADDWIADYEMGNSTEFEATVDALLKEIMPLYRELHAYVRGRLCRIYPKRFDCNGPIPAHLLGNMWAQNWQDRLDDLMPYPDSPLVNMTKALVNNGYSTDDMYLIAQKFFTSIGLYPMAEKFWSRSLFKKPKDRDVVCQAAATDLDYRDDYRVRICTELNDDNFYTVHHEMGHIEYYMAYAHTQPYVYREGANSGFHEAIGDTIGMYAISPLHLVELGFLDPNKLTPHYEMNFLLRMALQKVAFLPFAYVMDTYRFALFRDEIDRTYALNSMWWAMRIEHGGIMAAVHRSDATNFDPGAKYHIPANVPYFRYFIAHILQFQFHRAMCQLAGQGDVLHLCDIYGRKDVGRRFKQMLSMGNSKPWPEILQILTGEDRLDSSAILEYFQPLYQWLKKENAAQGYPVGWM